MTDLPSLGPRGEGWVVIQSALIAALALAGLGGPAWSGDLRLLTTAGAAIVGVAGLGLAVAGLMALGPSLTPFPRPRPTGSLIETGPYALVRHPIYGGLVLGAVAWGLATAAPAALAMAAALFAFFAVKSRREEAWLAEQYRGYAAYRRRTRRLIPFLY